MELLELRITGPIARLIIRHPERRNAFTRAMWRALPALVQEAMARPEVRLLCLQSGQPGMFAAGADISEFEQTYASPDEGQRAAREIQQAVDALEHCPLPVVALIDGACVGGGVALAVACDLRLASARARFAVTPARLGLSYHPDDLRRLARACGFAAATELLFTAGTWPAEQALASGLVQRLWPVDGFEAEAQALLQAIAANSLEALQAIKQGLRAIAGDSAEALQASERRFLELFGGADFMEGRDAFLQKRAAAFPSHRPHP
jgi:enoyl-CoA hydratase/carnithine racemase